MFCKSPIFSKTGLVTAAFFALAYPATATADIISEERDGVYVEDAFITASKKGGTATLKFKITNFGLRSISLQGIKSKMSETGKIVINVPESGPEPIKNLLILEEETLNLASSHLKGEFYNLTDDLVAGTDMEFTLVFTDFTTTAIAHVH